MPFFGNIPVIGKAFFTSNTKSIKDRELILFVTPYIITDPSMLEEPTPPVKRLDFDEEKAPFLEGEGEAVVQGTEGRAGRKNRILTIISISGKN